MNPLVVHIISGNAFFSGSGLICAGLFMIHFGVKRAAGISRMAILIGLILVAVSSTPLPLTFWIVSASLTLTCLFTAAVRRWKRLAPAVILLWLIAAGWEVSWHLTPRTSPGPAPDARPIVILADSVTAGLGEGEAVTWPELLRAQTRRRIIDTSHVGETVASAEKRIRATSLPDECIVILQLGGNDILGSTSADEFHEAMESLLSYISTETREVFLFELPLPPFQNRWGRTQRQLSRRFHVRVIPKYHMSRVFGNTASTLDSIHLSQEGHTEMAEIVCRVLQIAP